MGVWISAMDRVVEDEVRSRRSVAGAGAKVDEKRTAIGTEVMTGVADGR
jgi:hypothetical protein